MKSSIYKARTILKKHKALRQHKAEVKRRRELREFKESVERMDLFGFSIYRYAEIQEYRRELDITFIEIRECLRYARPYRNRQYRVYQL
jgi:hypothetical protein